MSDFLMQLARGQTCKINYPICNHDPETTVCAHYRTHFLGAGMGKKPHPIFSAHACDRCHSVADGRIHITGLERETVRFYHALGVLKTIQWLMDEGYVHVGKTR